MMRGPVQDPQLGWRVPVVGQGVRDKGEIVDLPARALDIGQGLDPALGIAVARLQNRGRRKPGDLLNLDIRHPSAANKTVRARRASVVVVAFPRVCASKAPRSPSRNSKALAG
ncbi:hypothetical protein [Arthrobacter sp. MMS18-M83]|uniref:hypothetical protein n=1 Tax=Arthrobacter sp. MMS18-M83 TaxID=2996261 RepID=UPI00227C05E3|nr:hypothetical protein [Arthrobacter sp. MMS18-M83]WAH96207.1 hypothetical protein OW521_17530 [Arthrobacter sp. MMS18-M83]